jgi:glycosyltransferase involved in cell wall biosynthesis
MTPPLLSVAIITHNEEQNLPRTLASLHVLAAEIIVVDSGSTDRTTEIARSFNARVIERPWPGFAAQKNFAIAQCTGEWVLTLDADEELSPDLQQEILKLFSENPLSDAFYLKRRNLFLARWIRHGGFYPDPKLRLFRRSTNASFTERAVHETISYTGPAATLEHDLLHHAYPTLSTYIEHMERYSTLGAEILTTKGRTSRSLSAFAWNVLLMPALSFAWNYIFRAGFLDGREGLLLHLYQAVYTSWKYAKAWESTRPSKHLR